MASNVVFSTAIKSLIHLARLRKGEVRQKINRLILLIIADGGILPKTVLIHSAAGGVGIASIQIAKMLGAEVYLLNSKFSVMD